MTGRSGTKRARKEPVQEEQTNDHRRRRFWDNVIEATAAERLDDPGDQGYLLILAGLISARSEGLEPDQLATMLQHAIDESERQAGKAALSLVKGGDA